MWLMEEPSLFSVGQTAHSLTCSIMEKPHTGLEDRLGILLPCFRKRLSAPHQNLFDTYMVRPVPTQGLSANFPIPIPSERESRIVGCSCEHDFREVVWFKLEHSKARRTSHSWGHFIGSALNSELLTIMITRDPKTGL